MKTGSMMLAITVMTAVCILGGAAGVRPASSLDREFDLGVERSREPQYFRMESRMTGYAPDGSVEGTDVFRLYLKCIPGSAEGGQGDTCTCLGFNLELDGAEEVSIPALENWTYILDPAGMDKEGRVFGIDHAKFENLVDSDGQAVPFDRAYHVYNAFIDFHAFCNVFAEPDPAGKSVEDLKRIGQKIVHAAAFSEPPTNLGSSVEEGSYFRNGEITLEFLGLSLVNGAECAVIRYDSGESSFKMLMKPMPEMEVQTAGRSRYRGDIYRDLAAGWVQKATMTEAVVSETTLPMPPNKIDSVVEREILIRNVTGE
jgi:hypothetical protein